MFERLRKWAYPRYAARIGASDDLADFEAFAAGPWTPDMARRMPWEILVKGPQLGAIDPETRRVIDLEIARRFESRQPLVGNVIALAALALSALALYRSW